MKKLLITAFLICMYTNTCYSNDLIEDYFDFAKSYQSIGNVSKSMEYVEEILKREPDNQEVLNFKLKLLPPSETKIETARIADGIYEVQSAVSDSHDSDFYNKRGREFYIKQEYDQAVECFKSSVYINSKNKYAYNNLGLAYLAKKEFKKAEKCFKKSNTIDRTYTAPLDNLSCLYAQLGDEKRQFATLKKSVKYNPNDFCAYFLLGNYHKDRGNYNNSIQCYKKVVELNKNYADSYLKLAEVYRETQDYKWSNSELSYYLALSPKSDNAYFLMAKNYFNLGDTKKAKKMIYKAIFINNCKEYRYELGLMNFYTGNTKSAIDNFEATLTENSSAEIYNYLGLCYLRLKQYKHAIINFNHAILIDGHRPIYYYNLAQTYRSMKDMKNYTKYINTVKKIEPVTYRDYIDLCCIYFEISSKNEALAILNLGIERYPNVRELYLTKIKIYEMTKDKAGQNLATQEMYNRFNKSIEDKK